MAGKKVKVTMSDVAKASGLSLSTVSLALNNKPGLPDGTRTRVLQAAQQLGYRAHRRPSSAPQGDRGGKLALLAIQPAPVNSIPPSLNSFDTAHLLAGVEAACHVEHLALLYAAYPAGEGLNEPNLLHMVEENNLSGLVLAGGCLDDVMRQGLERLGLPVILIEPEQPGQGFDTLFIDHYAGAFAAVRHLIERGHRRIACLSWKSHRLSGPTGDYQASRHGYQQALAVHGIEQSCLVDYPPDDRQTGLTVVDRLLANHPAITAIFAADPGAAFLALHSAQASGLGVPGDLSIIGVESAELAENAIPPLTSIEADWEDLGRLAVRTLLARAANPYQGTVSAYLHPRLVQRQTVKDC